jgi:hypothetical protein
LDITLPLHFLYFLHFLRDWSGLIDEILRFELLRGGFRNKAYIVSNAQTIAENTLAVCLSGVGGVAGMNPPVPVTCLGPPDEALRFPHSKSHFRLHLMPGGFAVLVIVFQASLCMPWHYYLPI